MDGHLATIVATVSLTCVAGTARADAGVPPWSGANDLPIPTWAKSVAPRKDDTPVFRRPSRAEPRRGTLDRLARPPLYGAARGPGCAARWFQVGPEGWVCSDDVELAADDPPPAAANRGLPGRYTDDGLPFHYAFVGPDGATAFRDLARAGEDAPDAELDPGFGVAIVREADANGERWGQTRRGVWIAVHDLYAARPLTLQGELLAAGAPLDVGWVIVERAATYGDAKGSKGSGVRLRFARVHVHEEQKGPKGLMLRVNDDGAPAEWMRAADVARPSAASPPEEAKSATTRWIDVDLTTETLLAYEGTRPVYAALVSTGRGAQGTPTATPIGVYHVWVKLETSSMGNLGDEDAESHYSIEDVPYVQFFAKGVALHGAFWHHSFGAAHSHGCVNLAPVDARWLFDFTTPRMPDGWSAVLPADPVDPGTLVRVRR